MEYYCGTIADILIAMLSKLPTSDYLLLLHVKGSCSESCLTILCLRAGCSLTGYKKVCISLNGNIRKNYKPRKHFCLLSLFIIIIVYRTLQAQS